MHEQFSPIHKSNDAVVICKAGRVAGDSNALQYSLQSSRSGELALRVRRKSVVHDPCRADRDKTDSFASNSLANELLHAASSSSNIFL
jgi:hypothetical protein